VTDSLEPQQFVIGDEIPALVWRGWGGAPRPVVIYMHGGGHTKRDVGERAIELIVPRGITLLSFDLYRHGDRKPPPEHEEGERTALTQVLERSARDLFTVIEHVRGDPDTDESRIGLRGYSHSANVALIAMGMGVPVRACLSVAGGGDLAGVFAYLLHRREVPSAEIARQLAEAREELMRISPLHHVGAFPPRPIMMIHGLHDTIAPFSAHFTLYEALLPYYRGQAGDCLFVAHADGHWTPAAVEEMGLWWLVQQLEAS
jgi:dienelactone hydrolase